MHKTLHLDKANKYFQIHESKDILCEHHHHRHHHHHHRYHHQNLLSPYFLVDLVHIET